MIQFGLSVIWTCLKITRKATRFVNSHLEFLTFVQAANAVTYAKDVKGNLLLVHGTGDDNVHCQNTMKFAEALVQGLSGLLFGCIDFFRQCTI